MWQCIPVGIVRKLMRESHIGQKLDIQDVIVAAKTMSKAKSMDYDVVINMFRYQFTSLARNSMDLPDWPRPEKPFASFRKQVKQSFQALKF